MADATTKHDNQAGATLVPIARLGEVPPGQTKKFFLERKGGEVEAFLVNYGGAYHAYVNRCCHVPMTMDWIDNRFLTDDGRYIQCATHGAWYEPDSGECVAGPPIGKCLTRVSLCIRGDQILAAYPEEEA